MKTRRTNYQNTLSKNDNQFEVYNYCGNKEYAKFWANNDLQNPFLSDLNANT